MPFRRILFALFLCLLAATLTLWLRSPDRIGRSYPSLDALKKAQLEIGYRPVGYFGNAWPATIDEVRTRPDAIDFARRDGSRHSYQGFEGYELKMVRLQGPSQAEVIVVFRSAPLKTTGEDGDESRDRAVRRL